MTTLNTIIEEEITNKSDVINDSLWYVNPANIHTAMQRAYEAGEKKGREGCQISDFKCSEHGVITPKPMCPKCSKT